MYHNSGIKTKLLNVSLKNSNPIVGNASEIGSTPAEFNVSK
jgi:hypothetical protein